MHFLFGLLAFLFICYLVGFAFFRNDPDPKRRFRKGLFTTAVLAVLGIGSAIYWLVKYEQRKDAKLNCNGYEGTIPEAELIGKWQRENDDFINFNSDHTFSLRTSNGGGTEGNWQIEYNMIYFIHNDNREAWKFCDFSQEEFIYKQSGSRNSYSVKRVKE